MTYQIVLLDGNNISYRVANIATTTTNWLQEQHRWQLAPRLHIVLPKSNNERRGNERERPISTHIASRDGDNDLSCHVVPMAATTAFCVTRTYHIALIFILHHVMAIETTKWLRQQHLLAASFSSFITCCSKATMNGKGMSARHIASHDGNDDLYVRQYTAPPKGDN